MKQTTGLLKEQFGAMPDTGKESGRITEFVERQRKFTEEAKKPGAPGEVLFRAKKDADICRSIIYIYGKSGNRKGRQGCCKTGYTDGFERDRIYVIMRMGSSVIGTVNPHT